MAQKDAKQSEDLFDKAESVPHAKKKVRSRIVKENDLDVWDSIVDAVADDHDFMQQELAESEVIDDLNAPKKRATTAKPKKTHHKKSKKKHARKGGEASLTQVAIEPTLPHQSLSERGADFNERLSPYMSLVGEVQDE